MSLQEQALIIHLIPIGFALLAIIIGPIWYLLISLLLEWLDSMLCDRKYRKQLRK